MGIKVYCDTCGSLMGVAKAHPKRIRKFSKEHGDVCEKCLATEKKVVDFVAKKRSVILNQMDRILEDAKVETQLEIRKAVDRQTLWNRLFGGKPKEVEEADE